MVDGHLETQLPDWVLRIRRWSFSAKLGLEPRGKGGGRAKWKARDSPTLPTVDSQGIFIQPERGFYSQEKSKTFSKWMESSLLCSSHSARRRAAFININEPKLLITGLGVSFPKHLLFLAFCPCNNLFPCPTIQPPSPSMLSAVISASEERLGLGLTEAKHMIFLEMIFSL